jgi:hypothetical protein
VEVMLHPRPTLTILARRPGSLPLSGHGYGVATLNVVAHPASPSVMAGCFQEVKVRRALA